LSYAHREREIAMRLAEQLGAAGVSVWTPAELTVGDNPAREMSEALEKADVAVVLITPDWVASEWAQREVAYFLRGDRFAGRIVPVLVRPTAGYPWILDSLGIIKLGKGKHRPTLSDVVQAVTSAARAA
jgi:hypothetical protein